MHAIFQVQLFAEVCTYLRYDVCIHRQTQVTFNVSVWGSLRLALIIAHVISVDAQTNRCRKGKVILGPASC